MYIYMVIFVNGQTYIDQTYNIQLTQRGHKLRAWVEEEGDGKDENLTLEVHTTTRTGVSIDRR